MIERTPSDSSRLQLNLVRSFREKIKEKDLGYEIDVKDAETKQEEA